MLFSLSPLVLCCRYLDAKIMIFLNARKKCSADQAAPCHARAPGARPAGRPACYYKRARMAACSYNLLPMMKEKEKINLLLRRERERERERASRENEMKNEGSQNFARLVLQLVPVGGAWHRSGRPDYRSTTVDVLPS